MIRHCLAVAAAGLAIFAAWPSFADGATPGQEATSVRTPASPVQSARAEGNEVIRPGSQPGPSLPAGEPAHAPAAGHRNGWYLVLCIVGAVDFAVIYGLTAGTAIEGFRQRADPAFLWGLVPVLGPLVATTHVSPEAAFFAVPMLVVDAALQLAGAIAMIAGFAAYCRSGRAGTMARAMAWPMLNARGGGVALAFQW